MKKFYSILSMMVLCAVTAFSASAASVTVIVDNPDAILIGKKGWDASYNPTWESLVNEVQKINTFEVDKVNFYIKAADNYVITSVKDADNNEKLSSSPQREYNAWEWEGDEFTYVVTTKSLDEIYTASCTINVDDPAKVRVRTGGALGGDVTLKDKTTVLKFDPVSKDANQLQVAPLSSSVPLYEVKLNGEVQTPQYGSYTINLTDGCTVDITAVIPDKDVTLKINIPDECKAAFKSVQIMDQAGSYLYVDVEGDFFAGHTFKAGDPISVVLDTDMYFIDSFKVNGEDASLSGSSYRFNIMENTVIDIEAHPYKSFDVDFTFDDYTHVKMIKGTSSWGTAFDLTDNSATFSFSEKSEDSRSVYIQAASGFFIKKITRTDASGNKTRWTDRTAVELSEGCSVDVTTGTPTNDGLLHIWLDEALIPDVTKIMVSCQGVNVNCDAPVAGLNTLDIAPLIAAAGSYSYITVHLDRKSTEPLVISQNEGETFSYRYSSDVSLESSKLHGSDIIRFFAPGSTPQRHEVTFDAGDLNQDDFTISVDKQPVEDWGYNNLYAGSKVSIVSNNGSKFYVKLNDAAPVESVEGAHSIIVDGPVAVKLSASSTGIEAVEAEATGAATRTVYNLQGIRVNADNLPAGIYIINGKKVAVK